MLRRIARKSCRGSWSEGWSLESNDLDVKISSGTNRKATPTYSAVLCSRGLANAKALLAVCLHAIDSKIQTLWRVTS